MVNPDFSDLFSALNAAEVRYLVVGGYAVTFHARPRFTKDLDVWIDPAPANAERAWRALARFGAPLEGVRPQHLSDRNLVFQIGVAPNRVDVLSDLPGVDFPSAWSRRVESEYAEHKIQVISRADLIANKRAVGRPQDLLDVAELERSSS